MSSIIVKLPRAYFTAGRVSTDELAQVLHQGLWKRYGVMPADVVCRYMKALISCRLAASRMM